MLEYTNMSFAKDFIFEKLRLLRNKYFRLKMKSAHTKLVAEKSYQKKAYDQISKDFEKNYNKLNNFNIDSFTTPLWKKFNSQVGKSLLPAPPFSFLNDPTIMISMFATAGGNWMEKELKFLEGKMKDKKLREILKEDYVGDPLLLNYRYLTSHTAIHHLHHLVKFLSVTKSRLENLDTIVEWGGGYGSLIRIMKRLNPKATYIIIDTPLFSCLQWLYLGTIFGEKGVNLLLSPKDKIKKNQINLLSLPFLKYHEIKADLFISTWALSESSKYSQDYVLKKNWFNAKHLLLAYQDNPAGLFNPSRIGKLAKDRGAVIEDMEFLPGNHYAFV